MAGGTNEEGVEMRSERESRSVLKRVATPWLVTLLWVGLLALSFWLGTAGPVDEILFGLLAVVTGVGAIIATLNELGVISV